MQMWTLLLLLARHVTCKGVPRLQAMVSRQKAVLQTPLWTSLFMLSVSALWHSILIFAGRMAAADDTVGCTLGGG
jgi:hypothetical protein